MDSTKIIVLLLSVVFTVNALTLKHGNVNDDGTKEINQLMDQLLPRHIRRARCESQCSRATSATARGNCLDICAMTTRPGICDYAGLCGEGCALGCPTHEAATATAETVRLEGFREEGCRGEIAWSLTKEEEEKEVAVRYIIVGQDGASMWSLVERLCQTASILLSTEDRDRFQQLAVVAVDAHGVVATALLPLEPVADGCENFLPSWRISFSSSTGSYLLFAASLTLFIATLVCCCLVLLKLWSSCSGKTAAKDDLGPISKNRVDCNVEAIEMQPMYSVQYTQCK